MTTIKGKVIQGNKKGRTLGFPTANIEVISGLEVGIGIYAGYVIFKGIQYRAAIYVREDKIIEAHLLNFKSDLYNQIIDVQIIQKIRENLIFKNDEDAVRQITKDIENIKKCLPE